MNSNQLGRFVIANDLIRDQPEKIAAVFAMLKLVPIRVECMFAEQCIEYTAISEKFDEVPTGECIPNYNLTIEYDSAGWPCVVKVEKERVQHRRGIFRKLRNG